MSNEWRTAAKGLLREGFCVEDIAAKLKVPVDEVRNFVVALRRCGRLREVLKGRRK